MLLWSFEGERRFGLLDWMRTRLDSATSQLGGHSGGETPLPIPNREVKPASADGTRRAISRESRTPPISFRRPERSPTRLRPRPWRLWPFCRRVRRRAASRATPGSSARSRRTRSPSGGWVTNSRASPSSANGFGGVERLGRRARLEGDEPHRLLEPQQRVREAVRRAAELGGEAVGLVLPVRREQQVHERGGQGPEHEEQRSLERSRRPARSRRSRRRDRDRRASARARRGCGGGRARARRSPRARPGSRRRAARSESASAAPPWAPRPARERARIAVAGSGRAAA